LASGDPEVAQDLVSRSVGLGRYLDRLFVVAIGDEVDYTGRVGASGDANEGGGADKELAACSCGRSGK
jgi:hypothetical protein